MTYVHIIGVPKTRGGKVPGITAPNPNRVFSIGPTTASRRIVSQLTTDRRLA